MNGSLVFDLTPVLPELLLAVSALTLLLLGATREREAPQLITPLAVIALLVTALLTLVLDKSPERTFGGHFVFDEFAAFMKVLCLIASAASILLATGFLRDERIDRFEFPILALMAALGMCAMVSANSFLGLYMALELQSLPLYVLAAFHRDQVRSTEAGLKYFVLGALASGMMLYGCSLVYGFTGSLSFDVLAGAIGSGEGQQALSSGAVIGLVFVLAGLAFKLAAVPFHMWTPDVYEGSPTPVTAFFAAAPKVAAIGLTLRLLMHPFGDSVFQWQQVIVAIAVASMLLGAFAAIGQTNIKRLMAYSGIANIGFALVGVAAGSEKGINAVLVYMTIYVVMTLGTFGIILMMRRQGRYIETINDLAGLSRRQPLMAAALAIFMFSLAGIPPLAGFFGKLYIFVAAVDAGLAWLAVVGVLSSVVGAYYYLRLVKIAYFDEPADAFDGNVHPSLGFVTAVAAVIILLFIVSPGPLFRAASSAAAALMR